MTFCPVIVSITPSQLLFRDGGSMTTSRDGCNLIFEIALWPNFCVYTSSFTTHLCMQNIEPERVSKLFVMSQNSWKPVWKALSKLVYRSQICSLAPFIPSPSPVTTTCANRLFLSHLSFSPPPPPSDNCILLFTTSTHFHHLSSSTSEWLPILLSIQPPENTTCSGSGRSSIITRKIHLAQLSAACILPSELSWGKNSPHLFSIPTLFFSFTPVGFSCFSFCLTCFVNLFLRLILTL